MEAPADFPELLARARAGDRAAIDQLLALARPWLEHPARSQAQAPEPDRSSSDLVQEAWLRAWQKLDQFRGADDEAQALTTFRAWLTRIVTRLGINAARDATARQRTPPGKLLRLHGTTPAEDSLPALDPCASGPTPSAGAQAEERARLVREALARLTDPLDRDLVRLRFFEGLSLRQVAARLGLSHETVRQRFHALLDRLGRELRGLL
jgi:RNA polymerase sigma factor (sigma-70 family)